MKNLRWLFLVFLILLAGFLRFYKLGEIPNGLYQDETAIGYNAYSILETGKDEHGISTPVYFKSFGDYKLPVYIYLTTISVKLFGLTEWAVRFPSALFGTLSVLVMYLFIRELFNRTQITELNDQHGKKNFIGHWVLSSEFLAGFSALLFAINPWHLHYSRATFEVSIALFFFLLGGLFLIRQEKRGAFFFGTLCFIIALYTYNLTRLLSPLLYVLFLWVYKDRVRHVSKNELVGTTIFSLFLLLPFLSTLLAGGGAASARGTFIFTSSSVQAPLLELRSYFLSLPPLWNKIFFNQMISSLWLYFNNVARYFSVEFFFLTGSAHGNHSIGNVGQFYLFELPLVLIGLFQILNIKKSQSYKLMRPHDFVYSLSSLILGWTSITILTAALTREAPHATRSFFLLVPLVTFCAIGLLHVLSWLKSRRIIILIGAAFVMYNLVYYFSSYYLRFPIFYAKQWRAEDKELALFIKSIEAQYDHIIVDKESGLVYPSLLFFQQFPPKNFQETVKRSPDDSEGFSEVVSFGKYEFRQIDWAKEIRSPRTLFVTSTDNKPNDVVTMKEFFYSERPVVISVKEQIAQYPVKESAYVVVASNQ